MNWIKSKIAEFKVAGDQYPRRKEIYLAALVVIGLSFLGDILFNIG